MKIPFYKMTGSGNDFIIIDNRENIMDGIDLDDFIVKACRRNLSVGADGIILIENSEKADFVWRFYNSDASVAEMCGNGSRCAARFAYINSIAGDKLSFETLAGIIHAEIKDGVNVKTQLTRYFDLKENFSVTAGDGVIELSSVNTGVPHAVIKSVKIEKEDLQYIGSTIRYHKDFAPAGTNVNLYQVTGDNKIRMRTYERGVEGETLACGTGAAACALIAYRKGEVLSPVTIETSGGITLVIYIEGEEIFLEGEARIVYAGELTEEAYKY